MPRLENGTSNGIGDGPSGRLAKKKAKERLSDAEVEDDEEGEGAALLGGQTVLESSDGPFVSYKSFSFLSADWKTGGWSQCTRIEEQECGIESQITDDSFTACLFVAASRY